MRHRPLPLRLIIALLLLGLAVPALAAPSTIYLPIVLKPAPPPTVPPTATATLQPTVTRPPTATPTSPPTPTTPPVPTATPTLPPPTFGSCADQPNPVSAPNYPIAIVAIDKVAETVTLRNVTVSDMIDLSGWTMCSVTGGQQHPIGGTLFPGQQATFPGPAGSIWNNTSRDDGALYNPEGRLASYRIDQ